MQEMQELFHAQEQFELSTAHLDMVCDGVYSQIEIKARFEQNNTVPSVSPLVVNPQYASVAYSDNDRLNASLPGAPLTPHPFFVNSANQNTTITTMRATPKSATTSPSIATRMVECTTNKDNNNKKETPKLATPITTRMSNVQGAMKSPAALKRGRSGRFE